MKIFDEQGNIIENPDLEKGYLAYSTRPSIHRYKITQEEVGHYKTIKEYPNGGKDVEWVVDIPEEGCWIAYDINGNEIECDFEVPADAPHEIDVKGVETIAEYVLYTEEELAQRAEPQPTAEDMMNAMLRGLGYEQ